MPIPTAAAVPAPFPAPATTTTGFDHLNPAADASFDTRWAAWQARGRVHEAATRRHALIGAPLFALVAIGLYYLLGR